MSRIEPPSRYRDQMEHQSWHQLVHDLRTAGFNPQNADQVQNFYLVSRGLVGARRDVLLNPQQTFDDLFRIYMRDPLGPEAGLLFRQDGSEIRRGPHGEMIDPRDSASNGVIPPPEGMNAAQRQSWARLVRELRERGHDVRNVDQVQGAYLVSIGRFNPEDYTSHMFNPELASPRFQQIFNHHFNQYVANPDSDAARVRFGREGMPWGERATWLQLGAAADAPDTPRVAAVPLPRNRGGPSLG